MNKVKLLFFGSDYKIGLTQALTEQILELQKEDSVALYAVSSQNEMESGLHQKVREAGVDMTIIDDMDVHKNIKSLSAQVAALIEDKGITHVNVHNNWQLTIMAYAKYWSRRAKHVKIIYTIHGYRHNSCLKSIFAIPLIGLALLLFADRVISMSKYVSKRFWFVGYKTDTVFYIMNKPEFNKVNNVIENKPMKMVFPAQFRHGKNQDILINAVAKYIAQTKDTSIRLYLPGAGDLLDGYKDMVDAKGLNENVIFLGKLAHKDVIALYEESNIALVSSNVETYGRCIAEPFALGRCLITKPTGVALDIIRDGENGFIYNTVDELTGILVRLHETPELVSKVANQAFEDKKIFSRDNVIRTYLDAINKA